MTYSSMVNPSPLLWLLMSSITTSLSKVEQIVRNTITYVITIWNKIWSIFSIKSYAPIFSLWYVFSLWTNNKISTIFSMSFSNNKPSRSTSKILKQTAKRESNYWRSNDTCNSSTSSTHFSFVFFRKIILLIITFNWMICFLTWMLSLSPLQ